MTSVDTKFVLRDPTLKRHKISPDFVTSHQTTRSHNPEENNLRIHRHYCLQYQNQILYEKNMY